MTTGKWMLVPTSAFIAIVGITSNEHGDRGARAFALQLHNNLIAWPITDTIPRDTNGDGRPEYFMRIAFDANNPLLASNAIFAYQDANETGLLPPMPRLVIWTTNERSTTEFTVSLPKTRRLASGISTTSKNGA